MAISKDSKTKVLEPTGTSVANENSSLSGDENTRAQNEGRADAEQLVGVERNILDQSSN